MEIKLPWAQSFTALQLPDTWHVYMPERVDLSGQNSQSSADIVEAALTNPEGARPISEKNLSEKRVLIIVDDNTRPTPAREFFHLIFQHLQQAGADAQNIHVMPALGIHTAMTKQEMAEKIGEENVNKISWSNPDAFDPDTHHDFGTTGRGTPVRLNREVAAADLIVLVGMIEPHLWAGFGGGMKNLFPGVASAEAIGAHHGMIAEPPYLFNRVAMAPDENTFRRDLEETRDLVPGEIFVVNVLLDENQQIAAAFAGDALAAHRKGIECNKKTAGIALPRPMDGVIVNSHPMDINFKQSMKCVGNALPALAPGGVIMGFLKAARGLDDIALPDKPPPLFVLRTILKLVGKSNVMGFLNVIKKGLNVEERFLTYYSMRLIREYRMFFHVPSLSEKEIRHLGFFHPCGRPQEVIDQGAAKLKKDAHVAVFPDGGATFPIMKTAGNSF